MGRSSLIVFTLGGMLAAGPARAQGGFEAGLRAGYALPIGDADGGTALDELASGLVPLRLDLALALTESVRGGLYGGFGFARAGDLFDQYESASGTHARLGLALEWRAAGVGSRQPWFGVSAGWEWLMMSGDLVAPGGGERVTLDLTLSGPEVELAGGVLFGLEGGFAVGPFVSAGGGRFENTSAELEGEPLPELEGQDKELHGWLQVGLRGTFGR